MLLALLALLTLLQPTGAHANERILSFVSNAKVQADGRLNVTEIIRIRSEGESVRHGIYRDFPTRYHTGSGPEVRVGVTLVEVRRDGRPEPFVAEPLRNGVRVRIGRATTFVGRGEHVYLVHYLTTRQLGFFAAYDELYWNATGTDWSLPIDVAEARITLPRPVRFGQRAVYTGAQATTGKDAEIVSESLGDIRFRTTRPLNPHEGLTVAVAWPKGVVTPPPKSQWIVSFLLYIAAPVVGVACLFGLLAFYFLAWRRAGHGPPEGPIVPIFSPPDGLSAAAVRYAVDMGADNRAFAAALVELGVRGKVRLIEKAHRFSREKMTIRKRDGAAGLPRPEAEMMDALFAHDDTIIIDGRHHATLTAAQEALRDGLEDRYESELFLRNWRWSLRGIALIFGALWLVGAAVVFTDPFRTPFMVQYDLYGVGAVALTAILVALATSAHSKLRSVFHGLGVVTGLVAFVFAFLTVGLALQTGRVLPFGVVLLVLPVAISAFWWMAAPTREGRAVLDRIAGFKHYLAITEEERLERMNPPEKTAELFERYLPYAIALDVENRWAKRFTRVLAGTGMQGNTDAMTWYSGRNNPWSDPGAFVDRVGAWLSSTAAAASAAPGASSGSASGSSGGGSSGGGGGGGGGGGW